MQSNPLREKLAASAFGRRGRKRRKISGIWFCVAPCSCCFMGKAQIRHIQKRLSKQTTLRSHRKGVISEYV